MSSAVAACHRRTCVVHPIDDVASTAFGGGMIALIIILLVIWLILAILGFAVKGLLWLAILGIVFFIITAIVGWLRRGASRS
jgi:hypothetical protein